MDTKEKKRKTTNRKARERRSRKEKPAIETQIVYSQAKPFNARRFFIRIATVLAVVLALIFGLAIFFKVDKVEVYGAQKYEGWQIQEASGIEFGDNLLSVSAAKAGGRITTKLPYIKQVRLEIALPDKVRIEVVELDVAYAIASDTGDWWLIDASGKVIDMITEAEKNGYTCILGITITAPEPGLSAVATEPVPEETDPSVPVTIHGSERLQTVTTILQYLEENGILGQMSSVDVTDMGNIELWMSKRYQILLGDTTQLGYKITVMKQAIDQSSEHQSGILDVSFTIWPDKVGYTPF